MKSSILCLLFVIIGTSCSTKNSAKETSTQTLKNVEFWPNPNWKYDTIQKGNSFQSVLDSFPGRYSIVILNHGRIAYENFQDPYTKDSLIHINSCTKTVISMLFGMVFKESYSKEEEKTAISYFPKYVVNDPNIRKIKNKHFLSMTSGLKWNGGIDASDVITMSETKDWAKYVFDLELEGLPGINFHYNSGGSQVIATLLHSELNNNLLTFATENLFEPLGISDFKWDVSPQGVPKAGWGLHVKMYDMAKLGHLMLKKGVWNEVQVIPKNWVAKMSSPYVNANHSYDYGYQVWIPKNIGTPCYIFRGSYPPSTKIIAVLPELNSVVVYVGENYNTNDLLKEFVVPVIQQLENK